MAKEVGEYKSALLSFGVCEQFSLFLGDSLNPELFASPEKVV